MFRFHFPVVLVAGAVLCLASTNALAQQTTVTTPLSNVGHSYYENIGSSWGVQGPGWFFRFGGAGTTPQFGNYDPNAGASGGFGFGGHGRSGYFNWWAGQGANSSNSSVAVTGNMISGTQAVISDTSQSPFVIGFVPVVGNYQQPGFVSPSILPPAYAAGGQATSSIAGEYLRALQQSKAQQQQAADNVGNPAHQLVQAAAPQRPAPARPDPAEAAQPPVAIPDGMPSSAERPVMSVAEARQAHAAEEASQSKEALVWMERARGAEEAGKANVAKIYYRMAAGRASGQLRQQALDRLAELREAGEQ